MTPLFADMANSRESIPGNSARYAVPFASESNHRAAHVGRGTEPRPAAVGAGGAGVVALYEIPITVRALLSKTYAASGK